MRVFQSIFFLRSSLSKTRKVPEVKRLDLKISGISVVQYDFIVVTLLDSIRHDN